MYLTEGHSSISYGNSISYSSSWPVKFLLRLAAKKQSIQPTDLLSPVECGDATGHHIVSLKCFKLVIISAKINLSGEIVH